MIRDPKETRLQWLKRVRGRLVWDMEMQAEALRILDKKIAKEEARDPGATTQSVQREAARALAPRPEAR